MATVAAQEASPEFRKGDIPPFLVDRNLHRDTEHGPRLLNGDSFVRMDSEKLERLLSGRDAKSVIAQMIVSAVRDKHLPVVVDLVKRFPGYFPNGAVDVDAVTNDAQNLVTLYTGRRSQLLEDLGSMNKRYQVLETLVHRLDPSADVNVSEVVGGSDTLDNFSRGGQVPEGVSREVKEEKGLLRLAGEKILSTLTWAVRNPISTVLIVGGLYFGYNYFSTQIMAWLRAFLARFGPEQELLHGAYSGSTLAPAAMDSAASLGIDWSLPKAWGP